MITSTQLKKLFPSAKDALVKAIVDNWSVAEDAGINTPKRIRQFFANIGTETGGLSSVEESLNYSVDALISKFSRARISVADAQKYGRAGNRAANQKAIANTIYGGAWGKKNLGNTQPNDGWDFRGGGMLQTTGRENYKDLGFENNPESLRNPVTAFLTAVREWAKRGCNALADADKTTPLRKKINGGTNGLNDVNAYLKKAQNIWPDLPTDNVKKTAPVNIYDGKFHPEIQNVQALLDKKKYPEVGTIDGKYGSKTAAAIMAFRRDNNLPISDKIDDQFLAALAIAPDRVIDDKRANATVETLREENVPEIKQTDQTKVAGQASIGVGGLVVGDKVLGYLSDKADSIKSVYDNVNPVVSFIKENIWIALIALGAFVIWKSGILQNIRLFKHQEGQDVSA